MRRNNFSFERILEQIPTGKENAVHMRELSEAVGLPDRVLRAKIRQLRLDGFEICSDERGYYFPETRQERESWVKRSRKRGVSGFASARASRKALQLPEGQQALGEVDDDKK